MLYIEVKNNQKKKQYIQKGTGLKIFVPCHTACEGVH